MQFHYTTPDLSHMHFVAVPKQLLNVQRSENVTYASCKIQTAKPCLAAINELFKSTFLKIIFLK